MTALLFDGIGYAVSGVLHIFFQEYRRESNLNNQLSEYRSEIVNLENQSRAEEPHQYESDTVR